MHRKYEPETGSTGSTNFLATSLIRNALQRSEHIAISTMEESVTYAELLLRVSRLADSLPLTSNGPDGMRPVGVVVDRSISSVVAIMAVRWAGLPVMPIAECEPVNRLDQVFEQTQPQIVIDATGNMRSRLVGREVLVPEHLTSSTCRIPGNRSAPDEIATIFFTSGSTGLPKLVARSNRVATKTWNNWDHPRLLGNWNHAISFSPLNFAGGFLFGIMMPAKGRRVSLLDIESPDIGKLAEYCESHQVDCMAATPSLIQTIHTIFGNRRLSSIKRVITFGEGLDWSVVSSIRRMFSEEVTVQSIYGASETAGVIAEHTIGPQDPIEVGLTPLGTPIDAQHIRLEPLEGSEKLFELVVVDNSVDRYHFSTSQTDSRFATTAHGSMQWKSQDVVSLDEKGLLHYRGRLDDMIKINGLLVEPAEVESVLTALPGVQRAVVLAQRNKASQLSLVAHLIVDDGISLDRIRSGLNHGLPRYLVPSEFVKHAELPITQRGKVDRARLRSESFERWRSDDECDPKHGPRNPLEVQLTQIWCDLLSIDQVGIHDNFFELGGHSLLVARMVGSIDRHCRLQISIASVFRNPTIAELARCLDHDVNKESTALAYESIFLRVLRKGKGTGTLVCLGVPNGQLMLKLTQQVTILQLNTEPHLGWGIEQFADAFALEVERAVASGPIMIVGYSYGGLKAFALARRLRQRVGQSVELVMIEPAVPPQKHKLVHKLAESSTERFVRHFGNLRACGAKGWTKYMIEKVSFIVRRHQVRWELGLIRWKVKLNLPLKTDQKMKYNGSIYLRNIRNYSIENLLGNAHLLGSAKYLKKHEDFWRIAVEGECRTRLLKNNSHHLDILDPAKSDEWISFLAELACE